MLKKASAGLVSLSIAAFALSWFVDFDATELGTSVLAEASASSGVRLEASSYRINLLRGLVVEGVEAGARVPGARYEVAMPAMRFQHRVLSLVRGPLRIERVVLVEPRVVVVTGLDTVPPPPRPRRGRRAGSAASADRSTPVEAARSNVALGIRELTLEGANVSFDDYLSLEGMDVVLETPVLASRGLTLLHSIEASGRIAIRRLSFRALEVENVAVGGFALDGGRIELTDTALEMDRGTFQADVELDLNSIPARHRLSIEGRLRGVPGRVRFSGQGFGLDAGNLSGTGRWIVPAGRFDDAPLWRRLALTGSAYQATELELELEDGKLHLDGLWIRGTVALDGTLDLVVSGREVTGTWDSPVVR